MLPEDLVPDVLRHLDAYDAVRFSVVARAWRAVVRRDAFWTAWRDEVFWAAESAHDHAVLIHQGWGHTRAGIYRGPLRNGPFGTTQTDRELAYQRSDMGAVVSIFTLRRRLERIAREWRGAKAAGAPRRSARLAATAAAGTVVAPHPRASVAEMLDWRRRIETASGGAILERQMLETLALFGGSVAWNQAEDLALRVYTFEEIELFFETGGREPDEGHEAFEGSFLRDGAGAHWTWPLDDDDPFIWVPFADLQVCSLPGNPDLRQDADDGFATLIVMVYERDPEPNPQDRRTGNMMFVQQFGGAQELSHTSMSSPCQLLDIAQWIREEPEDFIRFGLYPDSDESDSDSDEGSYGAWPYGVNL